MVEEELFRQCKENDKDAHANSGKLISVMESMGILRDDPRLSPLVKELRKIQKLKPKEIFSINNIWLDYNNFSKAVKSCKCLISDVFEANIIIPEWEEFCENITDIFKM